MDRTRGLTVAIDDAARFEVKIAHKHRYILRTAPALILFGAPLAFLLSPYADPALARLSGAERLGVFALAAVFALAVGVDAGANFLRALTDGPLLRVTPARIVGYDGAMRRVFAWDEIGQVGEAQGDLVIEARPRGLYARFSAATTYFGSHRRWTKALRVPVDCADAGVAEIRAAMTRLDPNGVPH